MIGGYRSILNPSVYSEKHGITVIPTKPGSSETKLKEVHGSRQRETNDCLYADQASSRLKDTFYNLVARTNMGTVLSYAYMHWRIKAQEMRADQ